MAIIVYGPRACGKTHNKDKIKSYFKMEFVSELDDQAMFDQVLNDNTVYLTNDEQWLKTTNHTVIQFKDIKDSL